MEKMEKRKKWLFILTRMYTILIIISAIVLLILSSTKEKMIEQAKVILNGSLLLFASFIPSILEKKLKVDIPSLMEIIFLLFATAHLFLGEINAFYVKFKWWDSLLHFTSGILLASLGFVLVNSLNSENVRLSASPIFISIFVFCFALSLGAVWEIIEYLIDGILNTNMQRFRDNYDSTILFLGRDALKDTMKDLILETISSFVISVIGYFDLKSKRKIVDRLIVKRTE